MSAAFSPLAEALRAPAPWLRPYAPLLHDLVHVAARHGVAAALNAARTERVSVQFVEPAAVPAAEPYEAFIHRTHSVPTRDNVHDLLNGAMWLAHPRTKQRLNALQAAELARRGAGGTRGALRDALTLLDENGAWLQAPAELVEALRRRDWHALFVTHRERWTCARLTLFGHALLEKLLRPRKAITAHVWLVDATDDAAVTASLVPETVCVKPFLPLPVLGVPGWWSANNEPGFYDDVTVFRR